MPMYPIVKIQERPSPDSSVIVIVEDNNLPEWLVLNKTENEYVRRCLSDEQDIILINSYYKLNIIVPRKKFESNEREYEELRRKASAVRGILSEHKKDEVFIGAADEHSLHVFTEGLILSSYNFNKYKTDRKGEKSTVYPEKILLDGIACKEEVKWINAVGKAVYFARDLVNEPVNHLNAEDFAGRVKNYAEIAGARAEIYGKKKIEALKMGGILSVNKGSIDPPTFSILEWKPSSPVNKKPLILVGKAVMFDTGGINLKPTNYIEDMKSDMAGGAVVASTIAAIAEAGLDIHIIGLIPATDNRPGLNAFVPGDIITMFNGKKVEIINTDAEGRIILADALSMAANYDPSLVISVATLTGSAENAFGNQAIAAMGNAGTETFDLLKRSGMGVYERIAEMPFFEEYGEMMKSEIADLKNLGDKKAGAITAGKFLEAFTDYPYIHLDIAGCSISKKSEHYKPQGATGTGVRLLTQFIRNLENTIKVKK